MRSSSLGVASGIFKGNMTLDFLTHCPVSMWAKSGPPDPADVDAIGTVNKVLAACAQPSDAIF